MGSSRARGLIAQKVTPDPSRLVYFWKLLASGGGVFDTSCDDSGPARKAPSELPAVHHVLGVVSVALPLKITSEPTYRTRHPFGSLAPMPAYTGVTSVYPSLLALRMLLRTPKLRWKPSVKL